MLPTEQAGRIGRLPPYENGWSLIVGATVPQPIGKLPSQTCPHTYPSLTIICYTTRITGAARSRGRHGRQARREAAMAGNQAVFDAAMRRAQSYAFENQWDRAIKEYQRALG